MLLIFENFNYLYLSSLLKKKKRPKVAYLPFYKSWWIKLRVYRLISNFTSKRLVVNF